MLYKQFVVYTAFYTLHDQSIQGYVILVNSSVKDIFIYNLAKLLFVWGCSQNKKPTAGSFA